MYTDDVEDDIDHVFLALNSDNEEDQDEETRDEEVIIKRVNQKSKRQIVALQKHKIATEELIL
jgi:hypothetical protein